jgi:hypothetical protein
MKEDTKKIRDAQVERCKETFGERISTEQMIDYFLRLIYPINKEKDTFALQFLNGEGNELQSHFWSSRSSSRLTFDFFSCLGNYLGKEIQKIEFEKILKGIKEKKKIQVSLIWMFILRRKMTSIISRVNIVKWHQMKT